MNISNKKGISVMIGYVLLISFAIVMSYIVYDYLETLVPKPIPDCPEGVSVYIEDIECNSNDNLIITLRNNGRFSIAGYYIHVSNDSTKNLTNIDLSQSFLNITGSSGRLAVNSIIYIPLLEDINSMAPGDERTSIFNLSSIQQIYSIEIEPLRYKEDNKIQPASCTDAIFTQRVSCV